MYCFTRTRSKTVEEPSAPDSEAAAAAASLNVNVATRWLTLVQGHTKKLAELRSIGTYSGVLVCGERPWWYVCE